MSRGRGLNERSSSSESQPDQYHDDDITAALYTFACADEDEDDDDYAKEALCDSSLQMQREVQRKLYEQIEVRN